MSYAPISPFDLIDTTPSPPIRTRRVTLAGLALIKEHEGLHLKPFLSFSRVWVIGYGHTRTVRAGMMITPGEADVLLDSDLGIVSRAVSRLVKVPLTDAQFDVLCSFTFQAGISNFETSTLLRNLNRGWYEQVPAAASRWVYAGDKVLPHLVRRRAAEGRMWRGES